MRPMVQARSTSTRESVIEAATELVVEEGHANVSMKELVERSGVSNGSIFHHFGSKDGVLEEIFVRERSDYLSHVAREMVAYEGDPCDALGHGAKAAIEYQARDPWRHFRLITQFSHSDWLHDNTQVWRDLAATMEQPVVEWALPHFQSGALPVLPPPIFQSMILGAAEHVCSQWRSRRIDGDLASYGPGVAAFVSAGLKFLRDSKTLVNG